jgi:hypothetical protein
LNLENFITFSDATNSFSYIVEVSSSASSLELSGSYKEVPPCSVNKHLSSKYYFKSCTPFTNLIFSLVLALMNSDTNANPSFIFQLGYKIQILSNLSG